MFQERPADCTRRPGKGPAGPRFLVEVAHVKWRVDPTLRVVWCERRRDVGCGDIVSNAWEVCAVVVCAPFFEGLSLDVIGNLNNCSEMMGG
ncbi:hypothetical protein FA13DRAFT_1111240 [Coprinellus micaceus]|uniref:Uncharacterized protein n=1 Tax=Coprinellus micaceus TaxID=71717 RepID=A0A4Y7SWL7_COPMI|nr:hypothetical protein FA13DRAFT_1111240 [Coprinellus micaceus]